MPSVFGHPDWYLCPCSPVQGLTQSMRRDAYGSESCNTAEKHGQNKQVIAESHRWGNRAHREEGGIPSPCLQLAITAAEWPILSNLNHFTAQESSALPKTEAQYCLENLLLFLNFILFIFLYSRFLLVIYFLCISVYMSIPISQSWWVDASIRASCVWNLIMGNS